LPLLNDVAGNVHKQKKRKSTEIRNRLNSILIFENDIVTVKITLRERYLFYCNIFFIEAHYQE